MKGLELGPGDHPLKGFTSMDIIERPGVDVVGDVSKRLPFPDGEFDVVYASHVLEHIAWFDTLRVLKDWCRVVRSGGVIEIWVPDALKIANALVQYETRGRDITKRDNWYKFNPEKDPCMWAAGRTFSYGDGDARNFAHPDWHRAIFTPRYLKKLIGQAGMTKVGPLTKPRGYSHKWINLGMGGTKP